jgi:hypothetical protein
MSWIRPHFLVFTILWNLRFSRRSQDYGLVRYEAVLPLFSTIKMETTGCSETLVLMYYITRRHISEDRNCPPFCLTSWRNVLHVFFAVFVVRGIYSCTCLKSVPRDKPRRANKQWNPQIEVRALFNLRMSRNQMRYEQRRGGGGGSKTTQLLA